MMNRHSGNAISHAFYEKLNDENEYKIKIYVKSTNFYTEPVHTNEYGVVLATGQNDILTRGGR